MSTYNYASISRAYFYVIKANSQQPNKVGIVLKNISGTKNTD